MVEVQMHLREDPYQLDYDKFIDDIIYKSTGSESFLQSFLSRIYALIILVQYTCLSLKNFDNLFCILFRKMNFWFIWVVQAFTMWVMTDC